jgi:hypothetical protein
MRARIGARGTRGARAAAASTELSEESAAAPVGRKRKRSGMSLEARKRMSEMMKKRWAERKKNAK